MSDTNPKLVLKNQFGEESINTVLPDATPYAGTGSQQTLPIDLNVAAVAGSNTAGSPKFIAPIMGNIIGATLTKVANYLAGVIGAYSITGTKSSRYPTGGVIGMIMDTVTDVDGAVVGHIDGDSGITKANAAFKASMKNSTSGSGFDYGLDLYQAAVDGYLELAILKADLRLSKEICVFSGTTAPVDGTTGATFAGKGSVYIARDTGVMYLNTNTKASPAWTQQTGGASALLTGFSAAAGTVAATDTIVQAFNKVVGNTKNLATAAETVAVAGAISTTNPETILNNAAGAGYAATLAAPSSQDGTIKVLKMVTATNPVTVAMTNIAMSGGYTPTGTTTMTFSAAGHSAVLMAVGSKWVYLGGSAAIT